MQCCIAFVLSSFVFSCPVRVANQGPSAAKKCIAVLLLLLTAAELFLQRVYSRTKRVFMRVLQPDSELTKLACVALPLCSLRCIEQVQVTRNAMLKK